MQGEAQPPPESAVGEFNTVDGRNSDRLFALGAFLMAAAEVARLDKLHIVYAAGPPHEEENPPTHAIDGELSTRWSAEGTDDEFGWIGFVLPEIQSNISRIDIAWYKGDERQAIFDLEYSASESCMGSNHDLEFTPINGATGLLSSGDNLFSESFEFPPIAAKCIRYQGRGNTENDWNSVTEFEIYAPLHPQTAGTPISIAPEKVRANRWQEPNIPANVVDSDAGSRWSCENSDASDNCRLWLDLGEVRKVSKLEIGFYNGNSRLEYFDIETSTDNQCLESNDGSIWQFQGQELGNNPGGTETVGLGGVDARCIRFIGRGNSANDWNAITTFSVFVLAGDLGVEKVTPVSVSASENTELPNVASNTVDGDLGTRWSCQGDDDLDGGQSCWIDYDLGVTRDIDDVRIAWFHGDERTPYLDLRYSENGSDWITASPGHSPQPTLALSSLGSEPFSARYIRYLGRGNSVNDWSSITELEIYAYKQ